jgi:hypothetical protein
MKVYPYNSAKQNDDDSVPNLYEIVYFYDSSVPDAKPVIKHAHYKETWNRAQTALHEIDK